MGDIDADGFCADLDCDDLDEEIFPGATEVLCNGADDDCDPTPEVTFDEVRTDGSCPGEFTLTRTWTAVDRCGNTSSASQTVTVEDTTPPTVSGELRKVPACCPRP